MALSKEVRAQVESVMQEYCAKKIPLQHRWNLYFDADAAEDIRDLLDEVDDDPTGIFWG